MLFPHRRLILPAPYNPHPQLSSLYQYNAQAVTPVHVSDNLIDVNDDMVGGGGMDIHTTTSASHVG